MNYSHFLNFLLIKIKFFRKENFHGWLFFSINNQLFFHEKIIQNGQNGLIFMNFHEKSYEIVRYGSCGLIFMNFHEKSYEIVRYGSYGLIFMKIHEKSYEIVRNGRSGLFFHEYSWKVRTIRLDYILQDFRHCLPLWHLLQCVIGYLI